MKISDFLIAAITILNMSTQNHHRFFYINHIISHVASDKYNDSFATELEQAFGCNGLLHLWDGLKYILLDQGVIQNNDPLFGSNSRRGRNSGAISLSKEQVYCEEIIDLARKLKTFDDDAMFQKYGKYQKKGKKSKGDESMINPTGNFTFSKPTENSVLSDIDENDAESVESFTGYDNTHIKATHNQLEQSILLEDMNSSHLDHSVLDNRKTNAYLKNRQLHSAATNPLNNSLNMSGFTNNLGYAPMTGLPTLSASNQSLINNIPSYAPNYPMPSLANNPTQSFSLDDIAKLISSSNADLRTSIRSDFSQELKTVTDKMDSIEKQVNSNVEDIKSLKKKIESQVTNEDINAELEKLKKANESNENIAAKVDNELKAAIAKSQQEIEKASSNMRSRASTIHSTPAIRRRSNAIWGDGKDESNTDDIQRVYAFAAQKIPKQEIYSEGWFQRSCQQIFDKNNVKAEVMTVEQVPANFQTAKTKTFKVLVKAKEGLNPDDFKNPKNWVRGTKISVFRRPRSNTFSTSRIQPYRARSQNEPGFYDPGYNSDIRFREQDSNAGK